MIRARVAMQFDGDKTQLDHGRFINTPNAAFPLRINNADFNLRERDGSN